MTQPPEINLFLNKVASFVKVAVVEIENLQDAAQEANRKEAEFHRKEAAEIVKKETYRQSLKLAAKALYEADFITDDNERKKFLKKAEDDPSYLSKVIEKVCNAADVSLIGLPARVAARTEKQGEYYDPVRIKAFGLDDSNNFLLEDIQD